MFDWMLLAQRLPEMNPLIPRMLLENQGLFIFGILLFNLVHFVLWVAMLVHAVRNPTLTDIQRLMWVLVIALTQGVGAIIYWLIGRRGDRVLQQD